MDASRLEEAGYRAADAQRRRAMVARILRMGVSDGAKSSSGDAVVMGELETELALLREENAQLKVERHRPTDTGHVIERMRSLRHQSPTDQQTGASEPYEPAQAIAESLAVREGLMEACQEVQSAMQGIRGRLSALAGDLHSRVEEQAKSDRQAVPTVEAVEAEPTVVAGTSPELAQSVA